MDGKKIKEDLLSVLREEGYHLDNMLWNASHVFAKLFEHYLNFFGLYY